MTRSQPTNVESRIKKVFIEYLKKRHAEVIVDDSIIDDPDAGFQVDGDFVGCELTTITRHELEKWIREKNATIDQFGELTIANRPDLWMKELLLKKNKKTTGYRGIHNFKYLWLLVHVGEIPLFGNDDFTLQKMRETILHTAHDFDMIWFVGEKNQIEQLWPILTKNALKQTFKVPNEIIMKKVKLDLSNGSRTGIDFHKGKVLPDKRKLSSQ